MRLLHKQLGTFQPSAIELADRHLRGMWVLHFNETESFGLAGLPIADQGNALHFAEVAEKKFEVKVSDGVIQAAYEYVHAIGCK